MININERKEALLNSFRMLDTNPENGLNQTHGLFMLCEDVIKTDFIIAEIGSYGGVSSEVFALYCSKLFCVDSWEDWNNDGQIFLIMDKFDKMISNYNHITKLHMFSHEAVNEFPDEYFDLVYIDANHNYDFVYNDINMWLPKVKKNGYISGHDYKEDNDTYYAVNDIFRKTHSITTYPDYSWLVKKK